MHEELKKEFEERFTQIGNCNRFNGKFIVMETIRVTTNIESDQLWQFIESKLPKEVEIEKPWDKISIKCPACRKVSLYTEDNFCPNCGSKINWK